MNLDTKKASITTAAVEIRALTVNDKQVTLAAFRQFPEGCLVDEEGATLNGVPWGWINYHWKDCASQSHRHVLWDDAGVLKQEPVLEWMFSPGQVNENETCDRYREQFRQLRSRYLLALELNGGTSPLPPSATEYDRKSYSFSRGSYTWSQEAPREIWEYRRLVAECHKLERERPSYYAPERWVAERQGNLLKLEQFRSTHKGHPETIWDSIEDVRGAWGVFIEDWKQNVVEPLRALPQLFIAV